MEKIEYRPVIILLTKQGKSLQTILNEMSVVKEGLDRKNNGFTRDVCLNYYDTICRPTFSQANGEPMRIYLVRLR